MLQIVSLCEAGALKPMCDLLDASDERTVCVILDGINNILAAAEKQGEVDKVAAVIEECDGLDKIENLQTHENEEVYQKSLEIIDTFFTEAVSQKYFILNRLIGNTQIVVIEIIPRNFNHNLSINLG